MAGCEGAGVLVCGRGGVLGGVVGGGGGGVVVGGVLAVRVSHCGFLREEMCGEWFACGYEGVKDVGIFKADVMGFL